jgi:propanediol utilization protein
MAIRIPIAVSARHAHLTQATIDKVFGRGYQLRPRTWLSQHGQFAAQETVGLLGPRGAIDNVRVMGPPRGQDQIELSRTDERTLGLVAPVRISGDLAGTPGVTVVGPAGRCALLTGVISARRHIHMSDHDASRLGMHDGQRVQVRIDSDGRDLIFDDVTVRIRPDFQLELHLDTDEANAAGVAHGDWAELQGMRGAQVR